MGYYKAKQQGGTLVNRGTEKEPKIERIKFDVGEVLDEKKGTFDHVSEDVIKYHTGDPPADGESDKDSDEEDDS